MKEIKSVEEYNQASHDIIGAAIEVHKNLGPGLLETVYEECLATELIQRGYQVERQVCRPIIYKGMSVGHPLKIDLLVEGCIIVELKAVDQMLDIYTAQLLTYLKLADMKLGLLINFNTIQLRDGIKRVVNGL